MILVLYYRTPVNDFRIRFLAGLRVPNFYQSIINDRSNEFYRHGWSTLAWGAGRSTYRTAFTSKNSFLVSQTNVNLKDNRILLLVVVIIVKESLLCVLVIQIKPYLVVDFWYDVEPWLFCGQCWQPNFYSGRTCLMSDIRRDRVDKGVSVDIRPYLRLTATPSLK